ncbi:MAG: type II toxin-antitoxin system HicB family antitoxin [Leptolyngbya sp. PLA3]|nr:MAG: type II toxin-antitoxin system HicB family antitoxin [Cyanobacteria bacterium CYA]MCE7968193.1 type II toxin-antitoxin system HicB family antitoxin [Leptolyngbya sp. PL-A3]
MNVRNHIDRDEDAGFVASFPALPGCVSQGFTHDGALRNVRKAIEGCIEGLDRHGEAAPLPIAEEIIEVSVSRKAG